MKRAKRVLVVLDDCGPGDALAVGFCVAALRQSLPEARLDCLAGVRAAQAVDSMGVFDSIFISRLYLHGSHSRWMLIPRKLASLAWLALRLAGRYQLVVTFYWGTTALNLLGRVASTGAHAGYANGVPWLLSTRLGKYDPSNDAVSQAIRLMRAAGFPVTTGPPARTVSSPRRPPALFKRLAVVHPGSDWACQRWLPERWAELADRLAGELGLAVMFTGLATETGAIEAIRSAMRHSSVSLAGATTLSELADLIARAEVCVSVDSLPFELAQAAGARAVVLAGQSRTRVEIAASLPIAVVNRTSAHERADILACKLSTVKASHGRCDDHTCPMSGLKGITVEDVYSAVLSVTRGPLPAGAASEA